MAGPSGGARMCMVQPPRSRERVRVGLFATFKDRKPTAPQILRMISEFNSAHGTSLPLICPQLAELVANPPSMFPNVAPLMAISILGQSGLTTHYPFAEGIFPTSSIVAYPGANGYLPREIVCRGEGEAAFVFRTGEHEGSPSALIAPNVSPDSLVFDGPLVFFSPVADSLIEFPHPPQTSSSYVPAYDASEVSEKNREAFCALGGMAGARAPKTIRRKKAAHACFVGRKGKHNDHASKTQLLIDLLPSDGFDCALVKVPKADVGKFMAHAPACRE